MKLRLGLFFLCFIFKPVFASSLLVAPVLLSISSTQPIAILNVTNTGDKSVILQLQVERWSQDAGNDLFASAPETLVTPPIFTLLPKQKQLIRIGLRQSLPTTTEAAYRVFMHEIVPPANLITSTTRDQLRMILQLSLPLFIEPSQGVHSNYVWQLKQLSPTRISMKLKNTGNTHLFIHELQLKDMQKKVLWSNSKLFQYLLPGQEHTWVAGLSKATTIKQLNVTMQDVPAISSAAAAKAS